MKSKPGPGYRARGAHGDNGYGRDKVDLDCSDCVKLPARKSDGEYVGDLRVLAGVARTVRPVDAGEQLVLEERPPDMRPDRAPVQPCPPTIQEVEGE